MADETENTEGTEDTSAHDQHLTQTREERDRAKARTRELEVELAQYKDRDRKAAEAKAREAEDFATLETHLRTEIRGKDEQLGNLQQEIEELKKGNRQRTFVDAIVREGNLSNRTAVEAMLSRIGLQDDAPEAFTDGDVRKALQGLHKKLPEVFPQGDKTAKPLPGGRTPNTNDDEYYRDMAARRASRGRNADYDRARGKPPG